MSIMVIAIVIFLLKEGGLQTALKQKHYSDKKKEMIMQLNLQKENKTIINKLKNNFALRNENKTKNYFIDDDIAKKGKKEKNIYYQKYQEVAFSKKAQYEREKKIRFMQKKRINYYKNVQQFFKERSKKIAAIAKQKGFVRMRYLQKMHLQDIKKGLHLRKNVSEAKNAVFNG